MFIFIDCSFANNSSLVCKIANFFMKKTTPKLFFSTMSSLCFKMKKLEMFFD